MAENPLLPDCELRALLALTKRCAALDAAATRKAPSRGRPKKGSPARPVPFREALLAATAMQLKSGDLLLPEWGDAAAANLAPDTAGSSPDSPEKLSLPPMLGGSSPRLLLAAAMAAALKSAGTDRAVLAYTRTGVIEPEWQAALNWAQERLFPLVLVCADARGDLAFLPAPRTTDGVLSWELVAKSAARLKLPVLSIDGEDAVAVYRAMQESLLRARSGAGPAILWAMLPDAGNKRLVRPRSAQPVGRLQRYLRTRGIARTG